MNKDSYSTIWEKFTENAEKFPKRKVFSKVTFSPEVGFEDEMTFKELKKASKSVAHSLNAHNLKQEDRVIIIGKPSSNWMKAFLGAVKIGASVTPLSCSLSISVLDKIIERVKPKAMFYNKNDLTSDKIDWLKEKVDVNISFETVSNLDFAKPKSPTVKSKELIAAAILTSGTTSDPKVVALSHANFSSNIRATIEKVPITETDIFFSIGSWNHVFPFTTTLLAPLYTGSCVVYCSRKSGKSLKMAARHTKPTLFFGVPKFYRLVYRKIIKSKVASFLLNCKIPKASKIIGKKLIRGFGGNIRFFFSGAAPLSGEVLDFFEKINVQLLEGYGMSETSPVISANSLHAKKKRSAGRVLSNISYEVRDKNKKGIGELVVRGPSLFKGYLTEEGIDADIVDEDGFFHTKDLVFVDEDDFLFIMGRKGSRITLSSGENVYPEQLQIKLGTIKEIENILILPEKKGDKIIIKALIHPVEEGEDIKRMIKRKIKEKMSTEPHYLKIHKTEFQSEGFVETETGKIKVKHYKN